MEKYQFIQVLSNYSVFHDSFMQLDRIFLGKLDRKETQRYVALSLFWLQKDLFVRDQNSFKLNAKFEIFITETGTLLHIKYR